MLTSKFFKDLENIRTWADEEVLRSRHTEEPFYDVHQTVATSLQELTNALYDFYYDPETNSYKYPTDEELEENESKKIDFENLEDYYQNFIISTMHQIILKSSIRLNDHILCFWSRWMITLLRCL